MRVFIMVQLNYLKHSNFFENDPNIVLIVLIIYFKNSKRVKDKHKIVLERIKNYRLIEN